MNVFVTGGTGVLGRPAISALVAAGHEVRAVARRPEAAAALRAAGAEPVAVDLFDRPAVIAAVAGADAVLHLATHVPALADARRRGAWDLHNRLRTEATGHLVEAARAAGAQRFVKESITFVYADGGDAWLGEDAPLLPDPGMLGPTLTGEQTALDFAGDGRAVAVLRFGLFYGGAGNRGTGELLRLARWRTTMVAGRPGAYMSSIHVDDAARAVVAALAVPTGVYNVVDDEPLTRRAYVDAFAAAFGTKRLHITPSWLMRRMAGPAAAGLVASQRASNRRFRESAGWAPEHPSAREGWPQVAAERREQVHA
jgi:nucleoside-diphosphate-sugar epimerase